MSADGSRVFLTTKDKLLGTDTDSRADIYEAAVSGGGGVTLRLITTKDGSPSNDESCAPAGKPESWNAASGNGKCDAVAFAGGAGVADDGTLYFVSPELLDGGQGEADQANLYIVEPGDDPEFVETIDSSVGKAAPAPINHPVASLTRVSGLSNPESISIDESGGSHDGDIYVFERGGEKIARFTAAGGRRQLLRRPAVRQRQQNHRPEQLRRRHGRGRGRQLRQPFKEDVYATHFLEVDVYAASGEKLGELLGRRCPAALAVEQSTGAVYVSDAEHRNDLALRADAAGRADRRSRLRENRPQAGRRRAILLPARGRQRGTRVPDGLPGRPGETLQRARIPAGAARKTGRGGRRTRPRGRRRPGQQRPLRQHRAPKSNATTRPAT